MADVKVEQRHRQAVWDIFERLKPAGYDLSPEEICDRDGWIVSGPAPDADVATVFSGIAQALANAESAKAEAQAAGTGWVSVEERLPNATEQVLVVRQGPGAKPWVGSAWYRGPKRAGERRRGDWEASPWGIVNDVTHWQPLPPAPEPRE